MIVTAGLTPAWQQILCFDAFLPGEVNRAEEVHWCASGKVLNVGLALARLGAANVTLAPLGGPALAGAEREFAEAGGDRRWIEVSRPTRVCTTILDRASGQTTELVENAGALTADELGRFAAAFGELLPSADLVVLSGSLPQATPPTYFRDLLAASRCPVLLDIRGPELLEALPLRPLLVKPNREELARTLHADLSDDGALHAAMRELNRRGAQWVVVTSGAAPVWASTQDQMYRFAALELDVINPIGSGDCLTAALAMAASRGLSPVEGICLGIAAAAENASRLRPADIDLPRVLSRRASVTYTAV